MNFGRIEQEKYEKHVRFIADNYSYIIPRHNNIPKEKGIGLPEKPYMGIIELVYGNV